MGSIGKIFTLHCDGAAELASESHERELTMAESIALRVHSILCAPCRNYQKQLGLVRAAFEIANEEARAKAELPTLSEAKREEIRQVLNEELYNR